MTDLDVWLPDLLDRLTDDKFLDFLADFTEKNCEVFDGAEELKLEYTDLHNQYKRLFESRVESFLKKKGCTVELFVSSAKEKMQDDPSCRDFFEYLLAVDDFEQFCVMMKKTRNELEDEGEQS
ncbi:hypothetical protein CYMTET_26499 [Cymbomonas tetramitiformis]|uniref:Cilia- and flagella-associated protein 36 n=1 Tax=Cymbomonas tetramitiformis TaxID=36881 RepID=A0AAE0FRW9_9CHLO|nr:hypothetical protein CYMTET_26499 [Cymbomonas tetramitiformis]|eukprot:gene12650-14954_t